MEKVLESFKVQSLKASLTNEFAYIILKKNSILRP